MLVKPVNLTQVAGTAALGLMVFAIGTTPAQAYVGPGLGLGAISTALGVVGAILLGIIAFVWYPIKRLIRRVRARFAQPVLHSDAAPQADEIVS